MRSLDAAFQNPRKNPIFCRVKSHHADSDGSPAGARSGNLVFNTQYSTKLYSSGWNPADLPSVIRTVAQSAPSSRRSNA